MSLTHKIYKAKDMAAMTLAAVSNNGLIPSAHRGIVLIEPSSICNLACPLCPTGTSTLRRANKFIPVDIFTRIVELTTPFAEGYVLNLFGEPMFHPEIETLFDQITHLPVWLSTNLNYQEKLAEQLARRKNFHVICSVDTLDPAQYSAYRVNGNWDTIMRNLDVLSRGTCHVHPQFLVKPGEFREQDFLRFAEERGIPHKNIIIKTKMENFRLDPTDKPRPGKCHSAYADLYFNCDGHLLPCCNNVREELFMGHVNDFATLRDLLENAQAVAIRKGLARNKNRYAGCGNCNGLDFWRIQFPEYVTTLRRSLLGRGAEQERPQRMDF